MSKLPSQTIVIEIEKFKHPEYPRCSHLELIYEIDLYYESADPSVGIMSDDVIPDGKELMSAKIIMGNGEELILDVKIIPNLLPLDYLEWIEKETDELAIEKARNDMCGNLEP